MGRRKMNPSSHHFNPIQGCSRCGAPNHKPLEQRKVPGWFYASRSLQELSKIPSLNPQAAHDRDEDLYYHGERSGKVQDWLRRCDRVTHLHNRSSELESHMTALMQGKTRRQGQNNEEELETNHMVETWMNSSQKAAKSYRVQTDLEMQIGNKHSRKMPLNSRFSRYLSNDGDLFTSHVRRRVGPIQRPHTPSKELFEKQKTRFGRESLQKNAAKQSCFVDFKNMRDTTNALHSELKTMLMN